MRNSLLADSVRVGKPITTPRKVRTERVCPPIDVAMPEDRRAGKNEERDPIGREAPIIITSSALVRLIGQNAHLIRERGSRRR
jgi:hypothetical protein